MSESTMDRLREAPGRIDKLEDRVAALEEGKPKHYVECFIGEEMYIVPIDSSRPMPWANYPYTLVGVDDRGLWFRSLPVNRIEVGRSSPLRCMRWPSVDYYSFDVLDGEQ